MKILVIDDDRMVCTSLSLLLKRRGYEVQTISNVRVAMETIQEFSPQLIILDMNFTITTTGEQGLKMLKKIRDYDTNISVILVTGWSTVQLAVEGMKLGAKDFMTKPWDNKNLMNSIKNIQSLYHQKNEEKQSSNFSIVGESTALLKVLDQASRIAKTNANVLITGENGTGKELLAEAIHLESQRNQNAFVKVNLGGIPNNLFESEMFGHKKGAFTGAVTDRKGRFEMAHQGTIFLDEIGEMEMDSQVKLLRVLQDKTFEVLGSSQTVKVDFRLISATNKNLQERIEKKLFREDLYYRINLIHLHLPSLSERSSDIPLLVDYFMGNISKLYEQEKPIIKAQTLNWLSERRFNGNIRQLKNICERTYLMNLGKETFDKEDFEMAFEGKTNKARNTLNLEEMEVSLIQKAMTLHQNSISGAARSLGITRNALYRRLAKHNISYES